MENTMMTNTGIETRVYRLENIAKKLAEANGLTNNIISELVGDIGSEIKNQIKEEMCTVATEIENKVMTVVDDTIQDSVRTAVNARGLNRQEMNQLTRARNSRMIQLLGASCGDKYLLYISFYQAAMMKGYRKRFECSAYGDIEATRFEEAITYFHNFTVDHGYHEWATEKLHSQYRDGEIENRRKLNSYERFFGIKVA